MLICYFPNLELHDKKVKYLYEATEKCAATRKLNVLIHMMYLTIKTQAQFRMVHK